MGFHVELDMRNWENNDLEFCALHDDDEWTSLEVKSEDAIISSSLSKGEEELTTMEISTEARKIYFD